MEDNKVKFIMETDWVFDNPIDYEYKQYKLLAYFKKLDTLINENKIYPMFTELSIHLASIQTILKENVILYTNKKFNSFDDEILLKEIEVKKPPILKDSEISEIDRILKLAVPKFFEYFETVKAQWTFVYDSITIKIKKNSKHIDKPKGFMTYNNNNEIFVWEYVIMKNPANDREFLTALTLIFRGDKKTNKLSEIIETCSTIDAKDRKTAPVFELKCEYNFPLEETLIPLFKRKVISYILQSVRMDLKILN
ncbi:MAG: hypothetical protein RL728_1011 [Bacteroidota bacterium]|jgi:hypothetical protein